MANNLCQKSSNEQHSFQKGRSQKIHKYIKGKPEFTIYTLKGFFTCINVSNNCSILDLLVFGPSNIRTFQKEQTIPCIKICKSMLAVH